MFANIELEDLTNPNQAYPSQSSMDLRHYYYQEKQIIDLLQKDSITEKEYFRLYLLVHTPIPLEHSIAEHVWLSIAQLTNYQSFKAADEKLKTKLREELNGIKSQAPFVFKAANNQTVHLLQRDMQKFDELLIGLLAGSVKENGYFTSSHLLEIECKLKQTMYRYAKQCMRTEDDRLVYDLVLGIPLNKIVDEESYKAFQRYKNCLKDMLPQLIQCIIKMRFLSEYKQVSDYELQSRLEKKLLDTNVRLYGFGILDQVDNKLQSPRIQAVLNELLFDETQPDEIKRLIALGAEPNSKNSEMRTVLSDALLSQQDKKALELLDLGADPDLPSYHLNGDSNLLVSINADLSEELILALIKKSKQLDYKNLLGENALMVAIKKKCSHKIVAKLIESSKELNAKNQQGYSALDFAIHECPRGQCSETIKALIQAGASLTIPNDDGNFPLLQAAYSCNPPLLKYLVQGAPELINEQNNKGETALFLVLSQEHLLNEACDMIDFLIKNGANPGAYNKEGMSALSLAKKNRQLQMQLDKTLQDIANQALTQDMLFAFISSVSRIVQNKNHRLSSAANLLMKRYLTYLHGLDGSNTPKSNASLLAQIIFLQKQGDFSVRFLNKIIQDIMTGGETHKLLLIDNPDLIDRFSRMAVEMPLAAQKLPSLLRSSRNLVERKQLNLGESVYLYNKLEEFLKIERLELGEDFAFILSDPRFWALPKHTLKLMYENQRQCKLLIRDWGLHYEHLRELNQQKLNIFSRFETFINELKQKNLPIHELIRFDADRLDLILDNPFGLYALLGFGLSLERLRKIEAHQLNLWLENPNLFQFLTDHKLNLSSIFTVDRARFLLLSGNTERLSVLVASNIAFESIVKLSAEDLYRLLYDRGADGQALEASLKSIQSQYMPRNVL